MSYGDSLLDRIDDLTRRHGPSAGVRCTWAQLQPFAHHVHGSAVARPGDVVTVHAGLHGNLFIRWPRFTRVRRALWGDVSR